MISSAPGALVMSRDRVSGRIAVVTGGARGIGLATARALHAAGGRVAIGDLDEAAVADIATRMGTAVLGLPLDVTDPASFEAFIAGVESRLGPIDVLINNAGIMPLGRFVNESDAVARKVIEVNVLGAMTGTRLALHSMLPRGRGHIINVASVAGKSPAPGGTSYCISKAGVVMLTEAARLEHRGSGIDFTCVLPSFTATDLIAGTKGTRLIKTVKPEDVARAIVRAIQTPVPDLYVPKPVGFALRANTLLGRRFRDTSARLFGADRTFLEVDDGARSGYNARIGASAKTPAVNASSSTPSVASVSAPCAEVVSRQPEWRSR
jgi:NAD(P)-dependent dehydrogenase (short-subunit alcohol dehydrogenase family)